MDLVVRSPMQDTMRVKRSRFNIAVPIAGEQTLLFNSYSQSLLLLDNTDTHWLEDIQDGAERPFSHALSAYLSAGVIVEADEDEVARFEATFNARRSSPDFIALTIATTLGCNLGCTYCFQGQNKPNGNMKPEVAAGITAYIRERISTIKALSVTWYGGEPLMNQRTIRELSEELRRECEANDVSYGASIITNGYLLTPSVANMLVDNGIKSAQITVDGLSDVHDKMRPHLNGRGSFDRIMRNIRDVVDSSTLHIDIRINISSVNASSVHAFLSLLNESGLSNSPRLSVYFAPVEAITAECVGSEAETLKKAEYARLEVDLMSKAVQMGLMQLSSSLPILGLCQAIHPESLVVTPSGAIHKCWDTVSDDTKSVGSLDAHGGEIADQQRWLSWSPFKSPVCGSCKILPLCGGACAFKAVHHGEGAGELGALPCPSIKFNIAERVFLAAVHTGLVSNSDWDDELSPTVSSAGALKTGERHSYSSVSQLAAAI